jgi:NADPH-dependent 2,4-dienoyl-CoA reductase/sulfur reductase-like enzyme/nitrite reductase/ring-hydroxylating ferredoxin subunit
MSDVTANKGPDLSRGVPLNAIADGEILLGHVGDEAVLLTKSGGDIFAVGATCTHYSGPLAEGIIVGDTLRCPLHHACFSLRTGEALRAPALDPIPAWRIVERDGNIYVTEKVTPLPKPEVKGPGVPSAVLIIGGGAAGNAAAEMLRREGFTGHITLLSADDSVPVDRPNLSKDYLAGQAEESWIPLRSAKFYKKHGIDLVLNARVAAIDPAAKTLRLEDDTAHAYDSLLLATGAEPVHLNMPGADRVRYLRTLDDSRAIIAAAEKAKRAVVIGASFIGLEAAAALRERGLEVHVVGPEARPLEKILGAEIGDFVRALHEAHGVIFHLGTSATAISETGVTLANGASLPADLIVAGIGVRPAIALAQDAGLKIDRGISVNEYLETSVPGIFAAGDLARWPDPLSGQNIRVEHWVVAEQQGQVAARNILGRRQRYEFVPFFWSQHYDVSIRYVGHAEHWDRTAIDGSLAAKDCAVSYFSNGRKLAVATIGRDRDALLAEAGFEASMPPGAAS